MQICAKTAKLLQKYAFWGRVEPFCCCDFVKILTDGFSCFLT